MQELLQKVSGLFQKGQERFLVIEDREGLFHITRARLDRIRKKITLSPQYAVSQLEKLKEPFRDYSTVIVALDTKRATTIESEVTVKRSHPEEVIYEAELDHLLFRALWEFLNHYRAWAAKKMEVKDEDLVLMHIEVRDVRLGSHRVFNPLGFKGNDFTVRLRGTFVPRDVLHEMERFLRWGEATLLMEGSHVLSSSLQAPSDFFIHAGNTKSSVFTHSEKEHLFYHDYEWGTQNITNAISDRFYVDGEVAHAILERALRGLVSEKVSRAVEADVRKEVMNLLEITKPIYNTGRGRTRVYLHAHARVPNFGEILEREKIFLAHFYEWLRGEGFSIESSVHGNDPGHPRYESALALLTHAYHLPHYEFLNQLLRRRAKWLIAHS